MLAIAGVFMAILLIFVELGFFFAVPQGGMLLYDNLQFDLLMTSNRYEYQAQPGQFPRGQLDRARAAPEVAQAPAAPSAAGGERPDLVALALERLSESLRSARVRLGKVRPWARQHRLALSMVAALLVAGVVLGNLLVQLRPARTADTPVPGLPAANAKADPVVASPAAPASTGAAASGTVVFRIEPWGEILIDKKPTGVSPPLVQMALPAGTHQIEVKHGNDMPWIVQINVEAALPVTVSHRFE